MQTIITSFCLAFILLTVSKEFSNLVDQQANTPLSEVMTLAEATGGDAEAEDSTEIEDDDDSAREHSRLAHWLLPGSPDGKHFFDHPTFDQTCIQVATPPPRF